MKKPRIVDLSLVHGEESPRIKVINKNKLKSGIASRILATGLYVVFSLMQVQPFVDYYWSK